MRVGKVGRIDGGSFLLDLQEERIVGAVALKVDAVVAQTDGAGADHLEGDIEGPVEREQVLALRLEHFAVWGERVENLFGLRAGDAGQVGSGSP